MSQSIPTGYIPPGNPRGLAQKTFPGGRDLTFESCPGAGNSTRTGILWKIEVKLQKHSARGSNFYRWKQKNKPNFLPFSSFTCFLNGIFPGLWVNFLVLLSHIPYKNLRSCPGLFIFEVFTGLWLSTPTFVQKFMIMLIKRFVRVLVLLVINTGCPKKNC